MAAKKKEWHHDRWGRQTSDNTRSEENQEWFNHTDMYLYTTATYHQD